MFVMLNMVKNFTESIDKKREVLRLSPKNGIVTQSSVGGKEVIFDSIGI